MKTAISIIAVAAAMLCGSASAQSTIRESQVRDQSGGIFRIGDSETLSGTVTFSNSAFFQTLFPIVFEGAVEDAFQFSFSLTEPTADRTLTLPDADVVLVAGTMVPTTRTLNNGSCINSLGDLSADRTVSLNTSCAFLAGLSAGSAIWTDGGSVVYPTSSETVCIGCTSSGSADLRIAFDASNYIDFTVPSNGRATIVSSSGGGMTFVTDNANGPAFQASGTTAVIDFANAAAASTSNEMIMAYKLQTTTQERTAARLSAFFHNTTDATRDSSLRFLTTKSGSLAARLTIREDRVGINTGSPDAELHVIGSLCVESSDSGCAPTSGHVIADALCIGCSSSSTKPLEVQSSDTTMVVLDRSGVSSGLIQYKSNSSSKAFTGYAETGDAGWAVLDSAGSSVRMLVDGGGDVGIGTTTPDTKLHVIGAICAESADSGCAPTSGHITAARFNGPLTGNVTGNADTSTALAANGTNCAAGQAARGTDASSNAEGCFSVLSTVSVDTGFDGDGTSGSPISLDPSEYSTNASPATGDWVIIEDITDNSVDKATAGSLVDLATISGTANQVVVTDNGTASWTLSLPQNIDTDADVQFDSITFGVGVDFATIDAGSGGIRMEGSKGVQMASSFAVGSFPTVNVTAASILLDADGKDLDIENIPTSGTGNPLKIESDGHVFEDTSSRRFKRNIRPLEVDSSLALTLATKSYERGSGATEFGIVAEDAASVLPEIVVFEQDGVTPRGIDRDRLTFLLLEEVKRLRAEVDELKEMAKEGRNK